MKQGKIEFLGGKAELVKLGEFDDVDMAMMVHVSANPSDKRVALKSTNNGLVAKFVRFLGKAAHAGGAPEQGINALNAASLALSAIHHQRETFRDQDHIRVHPILTRGGETVNIVPRIATMETFVRGATIEPILEANTKVDRALRGAALAVGAGVEITTLPGYLPLAPNETLVELYGGNAEKLVDPSDINPDLGHRSGSTDMGDLSQIMPCLHPYSGGAQGNGHGSDYEIVDYETAAVIPAKADGDDGGRPAGERRLGRQEDRRGDHAQHDEAAVPRAAAQPGLGAPLPRGVVPPCPSRLSCFWHRPGRDLPCYGSVARAEHRGKGEIVRVLVTGATGNVGRLVVDQLLGTGVEIRALTNNPGKAALPQASRLSRGSSASPRR